jgi:tetraprenyl-beta-curcumene synthase
MDIEVATTLAYISRILPQAERQLDRWRTHAVEISCPQLREQALTSISHKGFHVLGGSVYGLYMLRKGSQYRPQVLSAIAAIQTISDYLDNLCDRADVLDERGFRQLHQAMLDALDPDSSDAVMQTDAIADASAKYYLHYPHSEDSGYVAELVKVCRDSLASLPGYQSVKVHALRLARLYCDLQSLKHLDPRERRERLQEWAERESASCSVEWWEYAAATGSTLGLFLLFAIAADGGADDRTVTHYLDAYFPWICGLHILLDYLIDLDEDRTHGDFNFVACYPDRQLRRLRLELFVRESISRAQRLPRRRFHLLVIGGLLALYLSDPKVRATGLDEEARVLCRSAGWLTPLMRLTCRGLRRLGVF